MKSKSVLDLVHRRYGLYDIVYILWSISYGVVRFVRYEYFVTALFDKIKIEFSAYIGPTVEWHTTNDAYHA